MSAPFSLAKCSLDFHFPEFSKSPAGIGALVCSQEVELLGKRWRVNLYPGGNDETARNYISCFLCCLPKGTISVSFRLSVVNQRDGNLVKKDELTYEFIVEENANNYGWPKHIARSTLEERASEFLLNDTLVVRLELSITPSKSFQMEIPNYDLSALYQDEDTADLEIHITSPDDDESEIKRKNSALISEILRASSPPYFGETPASTVTPSSTQVERLLKSKNYIHSGDKSSNIVEKSCTVLKAHKLVLSAFSEVFKTMLFGCMKEACTNKLTIVDFSVQAVKRMLEFCYRGNFEFDNHSDLLELLALSCKYQIKALTARCVVYLMDRLSEKNVIEILRVVDTLMLGEVKEAVMRFIVAHPGSVVEGASQLEACGKRLLIEVMIRRASGDKMVKTK